MKKNFLRAIAYFMVAMLAMQLLFNNGSENSKAAHSETGTISYINNIRVVIEAGTNKISPCYCIAQYKGVQSGDYVTSDFQLDAEKTLLINTTMLLGFNVKGEDIAKLSADYINNKITTQQVIWDIIDGKFSLATYNDVPNDLSSLNYFNPNSLKQKVYYQVLAPSYVNDTENLLKWNDTTKQFELVLTNTTIKGNLSANATVKADETTLPEGVKVVTEGENLKITSTKEYLDVQTIKLYKRPEVKGKIVAWNNGPDKQPQVSLDYDEDPVAKVMDLKIKTENKPVEPTPEPTPEPTKKPETKPEQKPDSNQGEQQKPVVENETVKVEEKNLKEVDANKALDSSPKTADSTSIALAYQLLISVSFSMICLAITHLVKRKRNRI